MPWYRHRRRVCPGSKIKRWKRADRKSQRPFVLGFPASQSTSSTSQPAHQHHEEKNKQHTYYVHPSRQFDLRPDELVTSNETLSLYHRLLFGTCVISPRDKEAFCKAKWIPFDSMSPGEINGWEKLVFHFLDLTSYVSPVKTNGAQLDGLMWADGWRKCSKVDESFGRFCAMDKLVKMMALAQYCPINKAAGIQEAS